MLADLDGGKVAAAARELGEGRAVGVAVDVRSREQCLAMAEAGVAAFGTLTGLVHAAGVNQPPRTIEDITEDEWSRVLDINLTGTLFAVQAVGRHLSAGGAIVTLASGQARVARAAHAAYGASKAGVLAVTKVAALEYGPRGVRVNAILPGFIDTEMNRTARGTERRASIERRTPLGRVGLPEEIAQVASFLLSAESSYVSGELIAVDGGLATSSRT